jgi:hypothetical protein
VRRSWKFQPTILSEELLSRDVELLDRIVRDSSPAFLVLLFVSNSEACTSFSNNLLSISRAYWNDLERRRSVSTSKLYFISFNASQPNGAKLFRRFRVTKVPTVILLPRGGAFPAAGQAFPDEWAMDASLQSGEDIRAWLEGQIQGLKLPRPASVDIVNSTASFIEQYGMIIIFFQVLFIFGSNAYRFTGKTAWMILSLGVYFFSISGCIYCFLRGAAPFGYSEQHGFMFIYPDRGSQFFLEGLMIGMCNSLISVALVLAGYFAQGEDALATLEAWFDGTANDQVRTSEGRRELKERLYKTGSMCVAVAIVFWLNVWVLFKRKAPWYSPFYW